MNPIAVALTVIVAAARVTVLGLLRRKVTVPAPDMKPVKPAPAGGDAGNPMMTESPTCAPGKANVWFCTELAAEIV